MPYINEQDRRLLDGNLVHVRARTPGELNYCITYLLVQYLGSNPKYTDYNSVVGVLECTKQELYRRVISEYEDSKMKENGDVYDLGDIK